MPRLMNGSCEKQTGKRGETMRQRGTEGGERVGRVERRQDETRGDKRRQGERRQEEMARERAEVFVSKMQLLDSWQ